MTLAEQLRTEGEQVLLMKQLHHRFSTLPQDYEIRIKNARAEELLRWGERILDAKSLEEVFEA